MTIILKRFGDANKVDSHSVHQGGGSLTKDLQTLSDLCMRVRLKQTSAQAAVLSGSVRRHVILPIRGRVNSSLERNVLVDSTVPEVFFEDRYLANVAIRLVEGCCGAACHDGGFLPLCAVLDVLLRYIQREAHIDIVYFAMKEIWADLFSILEGHLSRWLLHGVVLDTTNEFFIRTDITGTPTVIEQNFPSFISHDMVDMLIFSGKAARCVHLLSSSNGVKYICQVTDSAVDALSSVKLGLDATFDKARNSPLSAAVTFEAACIVWRARAAKLLSQVLPFDQIATRIRHLRDFLLLGNSSFWRCVFDDMRMSSHLVLRDELSEEARQVAEKVLNRLLLAAAVETGHTDEYVGLSEDSNSSASELLELQVSRDCSVTPRFALSLAESQVLGSRASVYCDAFAVTFGARRAACELRASFAHLLFLERQIRADWQRVRVHVIGCNVPKTSGIRRSTCVLVGAMELRRRMMCFVECVEWYLQAEVIQPKFDKLLTLMNYYPLEKLSTERFNTYKFHSSTFFDIATETHNRLLDDLFRECFVADDAINVRLNTIFEVCVNFCQFLRSTNVETILGRHFTNTVTNINRDFSRNVSLLLQMLTVYNKKGESNVGSLLLRLNYNKKKPEWL